MLESRFFAQAIMPKIFRSTWTGEDLLYKSIYINIRMSIFSIPCHINYQYLIEINNEKHCLQQEEINHRLVDSLITQAAKLENYRFRIDCNTWTDSTPNGWTENGQMTSSE